MNIGEFLGAMVQTGMSPSSSERMKNSLGGGNVMDSLSGMLGKSDGQGGGDRNLAVGGLGAVSRISRYPSGFWNLSWMPKKKNSSRVQN